MCTYSSAGTGSSYSSYTLSLQEHFLYGISRLGLYGRLLNLKTAVASGSVVNYQRGNKSYELANHLGNVLSVISDRKQGISVDGFRVQNYRAVVGEARDYYPFGMEQPGRTGYGLAGGGLGIGDTGINGYTLPGTLRVSSRSGNAPSSYVAGHRIDFTEGFVSGVSDGFEAYIADNSYAGTGNGGTVANTAGNGYRYGFNGKENDNEVKGEGNQIDYGLRVYDPRLGRFLSIDPLTGKFPFYTPYQYAGNSPIRFIDLDGAETYDNSAKYWANQPLINISGANGRSNAAGIPRNAIWFFKQQLAAKPEMFSEANKVNITNRINPIVDEQWVKYNPSAAPYLGDKLIHHHIDGGEMVAGIPQQLHRDAFSELHAYATGGKTPKGSRVSGIAGGTLNILGTVGMFSGMFTGDPEAWVNAFGFGEPNVGDIKKDWGGSGLYVQIMSITQHYVSVFDKNGQPVIDEGTGQPKYRLGSKTVTANVYSGYIWDEDSKKFKGVNKVDTKTEEWKYNESGNRTEEKPLGPVI